MADLKPCPFCGGEAELRHYEDFTKDFSSVYKFYVQCNNCEAQSKPTANVERAENAWNTREPMESVVSELEEMLKNGLSCSECNVEISYGGYCFGNCEENAFAKAISIVRGKE